MQEYKDWAVQHVCLEALPVHDGRTRLVVLLLGDPHLLEGGEGGQDGATDPDGVPEDVNKDVDKVKAMGQEERMKTYFLSGGAMVLIFMVEGAREVISFCILSAIPGYMVVPPDSTVLAYRSFLMSTSHFMMEL